MAQDLHRELLRAGWEYDTATQRYRLPDLTDWLTLNAARMVAFGPPAPVAEQPSVEPEPSVVDLLKAILAAVQAVERAINGRDL